MKVAIVGSTGYHSRMLQHADTLRTAGHTVKLPTFDSALGLNELEVCEHNRVMITWADRVDLFWDGRSGGVLFDFGMCFALRKPLKVVYLEEKTFAGVMRRYEEAPGNSIRTTEKGDNI